MGKYVIIKSKLSEFETNIQEADAELWQSQTAYLSNVDKGEFVFMTGVDNISCQCSMACCDRRSNGKRWRTASI